MKQYLIKLLVNLAIKYLKEWVAKTRNKEDIKRFKKVVAGVHFDPSNEFEIDPSERNYYLED